MYNNKWTGSSCAEVSLLDSWKAGDGYECIRNHYDLFCSYNPRTETDRCSHKQKSEISMNKATA